MRFTLSPAASNACVTACRVVLTLNFSVKIFASDYIVKDETKPFSPNNSYLLEINAHCLWAHHHFAEGQKRNVAAAILDAYFYPKTFNPKNKKYLI